MIVLVTDREVINTIIITLNLRLQNMIIFKVMGQWVKLPNKHPSMQQRGLTYSWQSHLGRIESTYKHEVTKLIVLSTPIQATKMYNKFSF